MVLQPSATNGPPQLTIGKRERRHEETPRVRTPNPLDCPPPLGAPASSRPLEFHFQPSSRRLAHNSPGLKIPAGVMIPVINSAGVTSKPGFKAMLDGLATRT